MNDNKPPLSLEDLLRLKRAERPPAEFWGDFDRQLRAKQLAALVEKRPWWQTLSFSFRAGSKAYLPIGATAVFALAFFSLRETPSVVVERSGSAGAVAAVTKGAETNADVAVAVAEVAASDRAITGSGSFQAQPDGGTGIAVAAVPEGRGESVASVSSFQAVTTVSEQDARGGDATPSARFIAANLAAAQDSIGTQLLSESHGFERTMAARVAPVEPLQQMTPPGETRRSARFMAAMASTHFSDTALRTAERVANRISVEELYDQPNRFGTRRGGVNMKF